MEETSSLLHKHNEDHASHWMTVQIPSIGLRHFTGIASRYSNTYPAKLTNVISPSEFVDVIDRLNETIADYWPCTTCYYFGYCCCPCTFGLSVFIPNYCASYSELYATAFLRNVSLKARFFDRKISFTLVKSFCSSYIEIKFPAQLLEDEEQHQHQQEHQYQQPSYHYMHTNNTNNNSYNAYNNNMNTIIANNTNLLANSIISSATSIIATATNSISNSNNSHLNSNNATTSNSALSGSSPNHQPNYHTSSTTPPSSTANANNTASSTAASSSEGVDLSNIIISTVPSAAAAVFLPTKERLKKS